MSRLNAIALAALVAAALAAPAQAQTPPATPAAPATPPAAPARPLYATTKVTDSVYIFRYDNHQSMFIVTSAGVIVTDPISERRPAAKAYVEEIRKITQAPIRFVIYSHSHFDHIAGGKPFKDLGAVFIAHRSAKRRILELKPADVVVPDEVVYGRRIIRLGGVSLILDFVGRGHSDNMLVMSLPKEKIIYTVDWLPLEGVQFRGMADTYLPDLEESMKRVIAMDWEKLIPGHPGPNGRQIGTKDDVKNDLAYLQDLSAAVKKEVDAGHSVAEAVRNIKLPKYEKWNGYGPFLPMNIERYCDFYNRGI